MNFKNFLCTALSTAMILSATAVPAFAGDNSVGSAPDDYSENNMVAYSDFLDQSSSHQTDVYASQTSGSDYYDEHGNLIDGEIIVWLPVEATLTKDVGSSIGTYSATVPVKVQGNIAGNEVVNVVPDSTVALQQTGKADITGTVSQPKTEFAYDDLKAGNIATTGTTISANGLSAGTWHGVYTYTLSLTTK